MQPLDKLAVTVALSTQPVGTYVVRAASSSDKQTGEKSSAEVFVLSIQRLNRDSQPCIDHRKLLLTDRYLGEADPNASLSFKSTTTLMGYEKSEDLKQVIEKWISLHVTKGVTPRYLPLSSKHDQRSRAPYPILALAINNPNQLMTRYWATDALKNAPLNSYLLRPLLPERGGDSLEKDVSAAVLSIKTINREQKPCIVHSKLVYRDRHLGKSFKNRPSQLEPSTAMEYDGSKTLKEFVDLWITKHQAEGATLAEYSVPLTYYQSAGFQSFKQKLKQNDDFLRVFYSIPIDLLDTVVQQSASEETFLSSEPAFPTFKALAEANADFPLSSAEVDWLKNAIVSECKHDKNTSFYNILNQFLSVRSYLQKEGLLLEDYISYVSPSANISLLRSTVEQVKTLKILDISRSSKFIAFLLHHSEMSSSLLTFCDIFARRSPQFLNVFMQEVMMQNGPILEFLMKNMTRSLELYAHRTENEDPSPESMSLERWTKQLHLDIEKAKLSNTLQNLGILEHDALRTYLMNFLNNKANQKDMEKLIAFFTFLKESNCTLTSQLIDWALLHSKEIVKGNYSFDFFSEESSHFVEISLQKATGNDSNPNPVIPKIQIKCKKAQK